MRKAALAAALVIAPALSNAAAFLTVTKSASPSNVPPNCIVDYAISVENTGDAPATQVHVIDSMAGDVTYTECLGCTCTTALSTDGTRTVVTADVGTINDGNTATITIRATVIPAAGLGHKNKAFAEYNDGGGPAYAVEGEVDVATVSPIPTFTVTLDKATPYNGGEPINLLITFDNPSVNSATVFNTVIWDTLPVDFTFLNAEPSLGGSTALVGGMMVWDVGDVPPGGAGSVTLFLEGPYTCGEFVFESPAWSYENSCGYRKEDGGTVNLEAVNPVFTLTKTVSGSAIPQGDTLTYYVMGVNNCTDSAQSIELFDTLPAGTTFSSMDPPGTLVGSMVRWTWPSIGYLSGSNLFTAAVTTVVTGTGPVIGPNLAQVDYRNPYGAAMPRGSSPPKTVMTITPVLSITISGPTTVNGGTVAEFTLTVRNVGTDTAMNVILVDTVPAPFQPDGCSGGCTMTGGVVAWPLGNIDVSGPNSTKTVTLRAKSVRQEVQKTVVNKAGATYVNKNGYQGPPASAQNTVVVRVKLGEPRVYPTPFRPARAAGGKLKFSELPEGTTVTILTLSGVKVRTLSGVANNRLEWDGKNADGNPVAEGMYLYVIERPSSAEGEKTIKGRFGLIR